LADNPPTEREVRTRRPVYRLGIRVRAMRIRARSTTTGRWAFKLTVALLGGGLVALGLLLVPLPGPGWAIVFGGLAILAVEFVWAQRLLHRARRILAMWTAWMRRLPTLLRIAFIVAVLAMLAGAVWQWIQHRYGVQTAADFWEYITTH
jgi:uncharacterized protein (TIGR02611 family)